MAREIHEIPDKAERLLAERKLVASVARRIRQSDARVVIISGRGSSGNAGTLLRYLFEARAGLLVSTSAPSVITTYRRSIDMTRAVFIVISQSGRSPDLVTGARSARENGALTVAIVNDSESPLVQACELILPIGAGIERSVAATKSVVLSMMIAAQLVASLTSDHALAAHVEQLPQRFQQALACDWSEWTGSLVAAKAGFVIGRGYGLGAAREIGLKVIETLRVPALSYSAAEVMHGPLACAAADTPLLVLRQEDGSAAMVDALIAELRVRKLNVFSAGDPDGTLPWIATGDPVCDAITMLLPAYRAMEQAALRRGFNPDQPPNLSKVTETL
ncbi:MAG TPA: SIS domain-containing protein [Bradyrhizobium sp.]|nr:SIS domain-containing protein [Bradyrhizobium sp.]